VNLEEIISVLETGKRKQKQAAMSRLIRLSEKGKGKEAIPSLLKVLDGDDEELRSFALPTITELGGKTQLELIKKHLQDRNPQLRGYAACVISNWGYKSLGYPVLRSLLKSDLEIERQFGQAFAPQVPRDFKADQLAAAELPGEESPSGGRSTDKSTCEISTKFSEEISVEIQICTGETGPTPLQLQAVKLIEQLPKKTIRQIRTELERRLAETDSDSDGEPMDVTILSAMIPPLQTSSTTYFLLFGDSDYDIDHGFACLFRNGTEFCVCDSDLFRKELATDDTVAFEDMFQAEPTISVA
jgi:hypothetical protein